MKLKVYAKDCVRIAVGTSTGRAGYIVTHKSSADPEITSVLNFVEVTTPSSLKKFLANYGAVDLPFNETIEVTATYFNQLLRYSRELEFA